MREDIIISVLIGLVGACNNNPKTDDTDRLLIKALAFPVLCPNAADGGLSKMIDELYLEKNTVAPGCANCASPCGNTSDYDMRRIYEAEDEIRSVKLQIISRLQNLAAYIYQSWEAEEKPEIDCGLFYKALSYISFDMEKELLQKLLKEIEDIKDKIH